MAAVSELPFMIFTTSGRNSHRLPNTRRNPKPPRAASSLSIAATVNSPNAVRRVFCRSSSPETSLAVACAKRRRETSPPDADVSIYASRMPFLRPRRSAANSPFYAKRGIYRLPHRPVRTTEGTRPISLSVQPYEERYRRRLPRCSMRRSTRRAEACSLRQSGFRPPP